MNLKGNLLCEIEPIPKVTLCHSILTASLKWQDQSDGVLVSGRHGSGLWGECHYKGAAHGCFSVGTTILHPDCVRFTGVYICDQVSYNATLKDKAHKLMHANTSENQIRPIVYLVHCTPVILLVLIMCYSYVKYCHWRTQVQVLRNFVHFIILCESKIISKNLERSYIRLFS